MATIVHPTHDTPDEDAKTLRKAFEGWGTEENTVMSLLVHRSNDQIQLIRRSYEVIYHEDLVKRLESELKGDFEKAMYLWILTPADHDAVLANAVIKSGKNYHVIVEISSILTPEELFYVRKEYVKRYKHSLEEDIATHTSGHLRQLLVGLVTSYRYTGNEINVKLVQTEVEILHEVVREKKGNQEDAIRILTTRSKVQLIATFNHYRETHGTSITKMLDEGSDAFQNALYTTIRVFNDHVKYYEKVLRDTFKKLGIDEDVLTRVTVSRAECDLKRIADAYYKRNSVYLDHVVAMETSGDYKKLLLTLLGK